MSNYLVLVSHKVGQSTVIPREAVTSHVRCALEQMGIEGATILPAIGVTLTWGVEESSTILLCGCTWEQSIDFALLLGESMEQECVGHCQFGQDVAWLPTNTRNIKAPEPECQREGW